MSFKAFLQFVELQTKVASVVPFVLGASFAVYRYKAFNLLNFIIMFISLIAFDMATTAINNYCDYKKADIKEGYNYQGKNAIVIYGIKESTAIAVIFILLTIAAAFGIILTLNTGVLVLLIGILCFAAGVFYTFGPIPLSRMPLGEIFSGFFMGFIITFLAVYIHVYNKGIAFLSFNGYMLTIGANMLELALIFLISIPSITGIANIMLANNICDVEEDIINKRFTLPYYIGRPKALMLFKILYYIGYIDILFLLIYRILPLWSILPLFTLPVVKGNIKVFSEKPLKAENFVLSVKNFVLVNLTYIISVLIGIMGEYANIF